MARVSKKNGTVVSSRQTKTGEGPNPLGGGGGLEELSTKSR